MLFTERRNEFVPKGWQRRFIQMALLDMMKDYIVEGLIYGRELQIIQQESRIAAISLVEKEQVTPMLPSNLIVNIRPYRINKSNLAFGG